MPDEIDPPFLRPDRVTEMADRLAGHAHTLVVSAGGVDRGGVPDVPYDWFGLRTLIVRLDEAREGLDLRLATFLDDHATTADAQALAAIAADNFGPVVPLPRAAR